MARFDASDETLQWLVEQIGLQQAESNHAAAEQGRPQGSQRVPFSCAIAMLGVSGARI